MANRRGQGEESRNKEEEREECYIGIEGKGGVTIRIKDRRNVTIESFSTFEEQTEGANEVV